MKKNYSEPMIKVHPAVLQPLMQTGSEIIPVNPDPADQDADAKENLLDGLFD